MFVDFDKVFTGKPQTELPIPHALVEHLSEQLPQGLKYAVHEQCLQVVPADESTLRFSGFHFAPTAEQKKVLGDSYTEADLLAYMYNSQQRIPLELDKEGIIVVNGNELPMENLVRFPNNPINWIEGALFIFPEKFDPPFSLNVGSENYSRTLQIKRVPHNSIHIKAFESDKNSPLLFSYQVNTLEKKMSMNVSFNLEAAHSIRDYVESIAIYNAFLEGKGYLDGSPLSSKLVGKQVKKYSNLSFWEKVLQIENVLGVNFIPSTDDISFDTICDVELLYQNLVNKTPIRDTNKIDTIDGKWTIERQQDIHDSIGKPLYFEFEASVTQTLFGVDLLLPCFLMVFNSKLTGVVQEGDTYKLQLEDASETQPRFTSMLCFKDQENMSSYRKGDRNAMVTQFHDAKRAREYIIP